MTMEIVTLIGSSAQRDDFEVHVKRLVLEDFCPLCIGVYLADETENYNRETELKKQLMLAHQKRIAIADIIGIIRKSDGGVGASTLSEILFAHELHKEVRYANDITRESYEKEEQDANR